MAIELELDTQFKFDDEVFEEGTPASKLPAAARKAAKEANSGKGIFRVQRVEDEDLAKALAELDVAEAKVDQVKADNKQSEQDAKDAAKAETAAAKSEAPAKD